MRVLDLSSNRLAQLPAEIGALVHLTSLCLSNNRLYSLPLELGSLAALEELTIGNNSLSELPDTLSSLGSLRMIDIGTNSFLQLPPVLEKLTALEELYASSNQIKVFPQWLCGLTLLRSLDLTNNILHTIPEEIGHLRSLEELLVGTNPMAGGIPVEKIQSLIHLSRLQLPDESLAEYVLTHLENPRHGADSMERTIAGLRSQKSVADLIGGNMGGTNIIPGAGHFGDKRSAQRRQAQFKAMSLSDEELLMPGANKQQVGTFGSDDDSFSSETPGGSLLSASDSSGGFIGSPSSNEDHPSMFDVDDEHPTFLEKSPSFERPAGPLRERSNSRDGSPRQRTFVRSSSSKVSLVAQAAINTQMAAAIEKETLKRTANSDAIAGLDDTESSTESPSPSPRAPVIAAPPPLDLSPPLMDSVVSTSTAGADYGRDLRVRKAGASTSSLAASPASAGSPISLASSKRKSFAAKRPLSENMIPKESGMPSRIALLNSEGIPSALPSISEMSAAISPNSPIGSANHAALYAPALLVHAQVIGSEKSYHVETGRDLSGQLPPGKDAIYSPLNLKLMDFFQDDYFTHFHQFPHVNLIAVDPSVGPVVASILLVKEQRRRADVFRALVRTTSGDVTTFIPGDGAAWDSGSPSRKKSKTFMELHALKLLKKQMVGQVDLSNARVVRSPEMASDQLTFESRIQANAFKFGLLYCAPGQTSEDQFYNNENPSPAFEEFSDFLAEKVRLKGWRRYNAGLDTESDRTGKYSLYRRWATTEIVFHVSTMLPFRQNDEQQIERKKHIGNDVVVVVFQDEGSEPFDPRTVRSVFNHVFIIVRALPLAGAGASRYYQVAVVSKSGVKEHTPLLPRPAIFEKSPGLLRFLFTKMINAERASYSAIGFAPAIARTRLMLLQELTQKHIAAQRNKKQRQ